MRFFSPLFTYQKREQEQRARQKNLFTEEIDTTDMTPEQIQAEKLRRQKLQEEADFDLAKDILGWLMCVRTCVYVCSIRMIRLIVFAVCRRKRR